MIDLFLFPFGGCLQKNFQLGATVFFFRDLFSADGCVCTQCVLVSEEDEEATFVDPALRGK
jgi:hypothetical protein